MLRAPVAYVSLVTVESHVVLGAEDLTGTTAAPRTMPLSQSVCAFSVATGEPLVIEDVAQDPLVRGKPQLQARGLRSYAGHPLTVDGVVLGSLCVMDRQPRRWSPQELDGLHDLAVAVVGELEHRRTAADLRAARDGARPLLREVAAVGRAVRDLAGRVASSGDGRLLEVASAAVARVEALDRAVEGLRRRGADPSTDDAQRTVDLGGVAERAVQRAKTSTDAFLTVHRDPGPVPVVCDPVLLEQAMDHVLVTLVHRSRGKAAVNLRLRVVDDGQRTAVLEVSAPSAHVPPEELERLVGRLDVAARRAPEQGAGPLVTTTTVRGTRVAGPSVRAATTTGGGVRVTAWWVVSEDD